MTESFGNLQLGPVIGIENLKEKRHILHSIFNKNLFVLAYITDLRNEVLIDFEENLDTMNGKKPKIAAIFITAYYLQNYEQTGEE